MLLPNAHVGMVTQVKVLVIFTAFVRNYAELFV
jgi:hypothetical protein